MGTLVKPLINKPQGLADRVSNLATSVSRGMWTMCPGIITQVNNSQMTVNVKLKVEGENSSFILLERVPVVFPKGGGSVILTPMKVNDVVLVGFSKYSLKGVLTNTQMVKRNLDGESLFEIGNAVVLAGFVLDSERGSMQIPTEGVTIGELLSLADYGGSPLAPNNGMIWRNGNKLYAHSNGVTFELSDTNCTTIVVAPSNALHPENAKYHMTGVDDQLVLYDAANSLPSEGGQIIVLDGDCHMTGPILYPDRSNISIKGLGKNITRFKFNLNGPCVTKVSPTTLRYKYCLSDMTIDNTSKGNSGGIGLDLQRVKNSMFERLVITNIHTSIKLLDDSMFNSFNEVDIEEGINGIVMTAGSTDKPNENSFFKVKTIKNAGGTGVDNAVVINDGNDNHFMACSFEDFLTAIYVNDIGNNFFHNRIECNDRVAPISFVSIGVNGKNNTFMANYYSGNRWVDRATSISDLGAGNFFMEGGNFKDQFVQVERNILTAGDYWYLKRSGSGDGKALLTLDDAYVSSGNPTQLLLKSARVTGKFISSLQGSTEKFSVDNAGNMVAAGIVNSMWTPNIYPFKSWSYDPTGAVNGSILTGGLLYVMRLEISNPISITHAYLWCSTIGSGTTNAWAAIYDSSGNLLAQSDNQSANMGTTGLKTFTFASPPAVGAGWVWLAFWATATVTVPSFARSAGTAISNSLLAASVYRYATADTGLTNTAPNPMGARTSLALAFWGAID